MIQKDQILKWIPRIIIIAFIGFISLFALDEWGNWLGMLIHLIPSFILIGFLILAWKKPKIGGIAFLVISLIFTLFFDVYEEPMALLIITAPLILISILFILSDKKKKSFFRKKEGVEILTKAVKKGDILKHETKKHALIKFLLLLLVIGGYFLFMVYKYGLSQGFLVTILTWSFFVLCTPIADAGFLIDFPVRLILNIRMIIVEIGVWILAIGFNIYALILNPNVYGKTKILILFQHILENPIPFWIIILISGIGTFLSIRFGDELVDKAKHHEREYHKKHKHTHRYIVLIFAFGFTLILYDFLLKQLGVELPI